MRSGSRAAASRFSRLRLIVLASAIAGCSGRGSASSVGTTASAIVDGVAATSSESYVVELVHPIDGGAFVCSGTLVAPNLILTARHCVSATPDQGFSCDESGDGTDGGVLGSDYDPATLEVYVGLDAPTQLTPIAARATRFFHDDAGTVCDHDLALLEISPSIDSVPVATLDLDTPLKAGQTITAVGWGVTEGGLPPGDLQQRTGVSILAVGPASFPAGYDVGANEFDVGESICQGDSGGPGITTSNTVIGVVSRGGNGVNEASTDPATTCVGSGTVNIYTEVAPFRDVILSAFAAVGAVPTLVNVAMGEACTSASECTSGLCAVAIADAGMTCTKSCATESCPSGFACHVSSEGSLCAPAPSSGSGCAVATYGDDADAFVCGLGALAFACLRRRRQGGYVSAGGSAPSGPPGRFAGTS